MDQFATACALLSEYLPHPIAPAAMTALARSIDVNGDGVITLGEFLEAFRKVDEAISGSGNNASASSVVGEQRRRAFGAADSRTKSLSSDGVMDQTEIGD